MVNQLIPTPFDGSNKDRVHFINQCTILNARGTNDTLKKLLFDNIKGKLKGSALSCIPQTATSVDDIIKAVNDSLKIDSIEITQESLNNLTMKNLSNEKFKERLVVLLEDLERGCLAMGATSAIVKTNIMEKTAFILKKPTTDMGLFALMKTKQSNMKSPSQLIDYFFSELATHPNSSQIMTFRSNNNNRNNNRYNRNGRGRRGNQNSNSYNNYNRNSNGNNYNHNSNANNNNNRNRGRNRRGNQNNNSNNNYNSNNNHNSRNINVVSSENSQTIQSHGDMERS